MKTDLYAEFVAREEHALIEAVERAYWNLEFALGGWRDACLALEKFRTEHAGRRADDEIAANRCPF